jgi:1-acyl-sn-glycerol-3-phosphate acyltransferase
MNIMNLISPIEQISVYNIRLIYSYLKQLLENKTFRTFFFIFIVIYLLIYFSGLHNYGEMLYFPSLRKLSIHDYGRQFFNMKVFYANKKTEKICKTLGTKKAKNNYILTPNHHGYISLSILYGIITNPSHFGLDRLFIGVHGAIMRLPFIWDICKYFGCFNIDKKNVIRHIERGDDVLVVPGGAREILKCSFNGLDMNFEKRDGILRIAYQYKKPVIPIYMKGANRIFQTMPIPYITNFFMENFWRYPFPIFVWGPNPIKIRLYVCEPVDPNNFKNYKDFENRYYEDLLSIIKEKEEYKIVGSLRKKMIEYEIIEKPENKSID